MFGMLVGASMFFAFLIGVALYLLFTLGMYLWLKQRGEDSAWMAFIPAIGYYPVLKIVLKDEVKAFLVLLAVLFLPGLLHLGRTAVDLIGIGLNMWIVYNVRKDDIVAYILAVIFPFLFWYLYLVEKEERAGSAA